MPKTRGTLLGKQVTYRLPEEMYAQLEKQAEQLKMSVPDWVREQVRKSLYVDQDYFILLVEVMALRRELRSLAEWMIGIVLPENLHAGAASKWEQIMRATEEKKYDLALAAIARSKR